MAVVHSPVFSSRKEIKWQHMGQTITKQTERDFFVVQKTPIPSESALIKFKLSRPSSRKHPQ